ncbi:MAG: adenosylcobinamide-phosphate synthase CbiB [Desulfarculaceae bacterium]|nr:adenosylcobinamide-phosphate synthase CbiB [Desulfarculaceae bacterium]MCF8072414.1 adenosylcobinamide-phosphate synthase CbiB [Desulfarculaceae bacterium]MCF8100335.1 adenosylcobinamide-phosphate synthase CbiB [Desulfarculaceae bacterium]MCF8117550.1 adenosylcobinamide-phosphate synthase CbiB [Desulfarculaceae bacterium]
MTGAWIIAIAALIDALIGDPPTWPHLVRYMGRTVSGLDRFFRSWCFSPTDLRVGGAIMVLAVAGGFALATEALLLLCLWLAEPLYWLAALVLAWQCLSAGQLWREARVVLDTLNAGDLVYAQGQLAMIVGRDTSRLDEEGVRRAVVETVAESFNDGVVAPLFYLVIGGPVAAVAYKAVNTMDSMVGYRNDAYRDLGWAAARIDDLAGWIPARLSALLLVAACPLLGLSASRAWQVMRADHAAHKSPNAAWPEAAAAGALGVILGGPNYYGGRLVDKPWINAKGGPVSPGDGYYCLRLIQVAFLLATAASFLAAWALGWWA